MESETSFGAWVRKRRKALDLTQSGLAQRVGCSVSAIRKIESDERRPSQQVADLLAEALQIASAERSNFLKVARGELRVARLHTPDSQSLVEQPAARITSPSNLPVASTALIGREPEQTQINHLLRDPQCRLLTLVGPGGIGKTRLAIAVAAAQLESFADGVYLVSLAPLRSMEFVIAAIANAIGITLQGVDDPKVELLNTLREKHMLLVLDNMEHLLPTQNGVTVEVLSDMLKHTARLKLLTTSRERLNLSGEWVIALQGLPVPAHAELDRLEDYSASMLFLQNVRRMQPAFEPTPEERRAIVRICQLLEGVPLGIELAAAWMRTLSCAEIVQEIERSLDFLVASARDVPERHRSMRAAFDHSWNLLSEEERNVFQRLSVFRGGFEREAAAQVADASLQTLVALVDKSLLRWHATGRYDFHELLRQYAHEHLLAAGELEQIQERHLRYFLHLAEEAEPHLTGGERAKWLERLQAENDNLRGALEWSRTIDDDDDRGLRLAGSLGWFWFFTGYLREGRAWLESALAHAKGVGRSIVKAKALSSDGGLAWTQADFLAACTRLEESIDICRQAGAASKSILARSLAILGFVRVNQGDHDAARVLHQESLVLSRELGDTWLEAVTLSNLGDATLMAGDAALARDLYQASLRIFETMDDAWGRAIVLYAMGSMALFQSDYAAARVAFEESAELSRKTGSRWGRVRALSGLAGTLLYEGDSERAASFYRESLILAQEVGNTAIMIMGLAGLTAVAAVHGEFERAAHLAGVVDGVRERVGVRLWRVLQQSYDQHIAAARAQCDEAIWTRRYSHGQTRSLEQAIAYALGEP